MFCVFFLHYQRLKTMQILYYMPLSTNKKRVFEHSSLVILKSATCNIFDIWGCGYLFKTTRFRKESLWCSRKRWNPLTPWCDLRQYTKDHEDLRLPKSKFEGHHVCIIACVYVQYVLSCSLNPFCRARNILEYKSFDSACALCYNNSLT